MKDKQRSTSQVEDKHTPGPWWYENETAQICANHPLDEQYIARIYDADSVHSEKLPQEANARLMAAAPELLEAIKESMWYIDLEDSGANEWYLKTEELIAKIEGDE